VLTLERIYWTIGGVVDYFSHVLQHSAEMTSTSHTSSPDCRVKKLVN